jgi:hypothetical protein
MRTIAVLIVATMAIGATACGGKITPGYDTAASPALTASTVTFFNRDEGKDADSAVSVELLRENAELGAEVRAVGKHWEHDESSAVSLNVLNGFHKSDINGGRVRVRLSPDGRDTWKFDMRLMTTFSDGSSQTFFWNDMRLDHNSPERLLPLAPARQP